MLIGCITGPDFETAKLQIEQARKYCDGVELKGEFKELAYLAEGLKVLDDDISMIHDFQETPADLESLLAALLDAPFYKIATMAHSSLDSLRMLYFVKDKPNVIGLCMGELGKITRILGPIFQNPITYAALGLEAAPGQLQAEELVTTYHFKTLSPKTKIYALIGDPITHSQGYLFYNRYFHENNIDAVYVKIPLKEEEIPQFLHYAKKLGFAGLSVTIPFKEKLFAYLDSLEGDAEAIGAVNTITFEEGKVIGTNTDGIGALTPLEKVAGRVKNQTCLILGAGGAARAIAFEAAKRGADVHICARNLEKASQLGYPVHPLNSIPDYDILINTIPIEEPISLQHIHPRKIVMETTPHFDKSPLMLRAKALGCKLVYGSEMLEEQARLQLVRWNKTAILSR